MTMPFKKFMQPAACAGANMDTQSTEPTEARQIYYEMFKDISDGSRSREENTAAYDKWHNYEEIIKMYAPTRPLAGAKAFDAHYSKNKDIKILDVGAGSGLAAEELVKLGYHDIDGLEPSEVQSQLALAKNIYHEWYKAYLCEDRLPIEDDVYDVIYAVGVFGRGHAKEDCLEELIRILKPGGQIMIVSGENHMNYPEMANFEPKIFELERAGVLIYHKREAVANYNCDGSRDTNNAIVTILEKPKNALI